MRHKRYFSRTMSEPVPGVELLPHSVFLRRLAATRERSADARLGRAAFVALRLVDLLAEQPVLAAAFHYQHGATERACQGLPPDCTETGHLKGVVASAADAFQARDTRLLFPALFAYAHFLEDELRLEEALDVLRTTFCTVGAQLPPSDAIALHLRVARAERKLSRFADADSAYAAAEQLAVATNDRESGLLSRVGRALSLQGRGNLGQAEQCLREVLAETEQHGSQAIRANAHHALGATLLLRGQVPEAIVQVWRAFELCDDEASRVRALGDLGTMLLAVGESEAAERALLDALRRGHATGDTTSNAMIELMCCASYRRDQLGFERWRSQCEARVGEMPPNILADFRLKAGIGNARFGRYRHAEALMDQALRAAESAGLHELCFRIERIRAGLRDCELRSDWSEEAVAVPAQWREPVREISTSLAQLGR